MLQEERASIDVDLRSTSAQTREFLNGLASDDDFRARLERDPQTVLAEHGIYIRAEEIPDPVRLPSKAEVRVAIAELEATGDLPVLGVFVVFQKIRGVFRKP